MLLIIIYLVQIYHYLNHKYLLFVVASDYKNHLKKYCNLNCICELILYH